MAGRNGKDSRNTRTVIFSVVGIAVVLGIMGLAAANGFERISAAINSLRFPVQSGTEESISLNGNFTEVNVDGTWRVEIRQNPALQQNRVVLTFDAGMADAVRYDMDGDSLELSLGRIRLSGGTWVPSAEIIVADLRELELDGTSRAQLLDLELSELRLYLDGATRLSASGGSIGSLDLEVDGVAQADLSTMSVGSATVEIDGASRVELQMDGGNLEGDLDGTARLTVSGEVGQRDLSVDGVARVNYRD